MDEIALRKTFGKAAGDIELAVLRGRDPAEQRDAFIGKLAEIDGAPAVSPGDRGIYFAYALLREHVEQMERFKPPGEIAAAIAPGHP
jgi:hypothetical protein